MPSAAEIKNLERGFAALSAGKLDGAEKKFRAVIASASDNAQAWHGLGLAVAMQGRAAEAVPHLRKAASIAPSDAVILTNYGLVQKSAGDIPGAIQSLQKAVKIDPKALNALKGLGDALLAEGRHAEAADVFQQTLQATPDSVETLINLGVALQKAGDLAGADQALTNAVALRPASFEAWTNLGNVKHAQGNYAAAVEGHQRALAAGAPPSQSNLNLSTAYDALKDFERALACLDLAIAADPNNAEAHRNKALIHLLRGDYEPGWRAYEWRWQCWDFEARKRPFQQPRWVGENVPGRILVWGEQGPGDEILYGGMAADLVRRGTPIVWEADPRLLPLIKRALPQCHAVPRQTPPHPDMQSVDIVAQIPIGSLGAIVRPNRAAFPDAPLPYLKADPPVVARLRTELRADGARKVFGLSWISRNLDIGADKSMALGDLAQLFDMPGVRWVDLQYGDTGAERADLAIRKPPGLLHRDDIDLFNDLDSLAALISSCDAVVTVSNTTAHLAGALGVPTLVLVSYGARKLWYWGEGTDRAPWYPSVRILRQDASGSWATAVAEVERRLRNV